MTVHTPIETRGGGVPPWAIGITVFVFLVGGVYLASNLGGENPPFAVPGSTPMAPTGSAGADPALGEALIEQVSTPCTACHGADLSGGVGPSLLGLAEGPVSENLQDLATEFPEDWIALWIDGTVPETEGIDRMGMPAFGGELDPHQIDSIVAYLLGL
jgi:mono/diheme cytochrome c family protein